MGRWAVLTAFPGRFTRSMLELGLIPTRNEGGCEVEGAFGQLPNASRAQDESARRLFLQPLSLAGEGSCEAYLLSASPSVDGPAGGLADRGISLRPEERGGGKECVSTR